MPERIEVPDEFPAVGDVSGKRVVLTGAGRGLGELIAHALSRGGAKVALVARTSRDLAEVADALTGPTLQFSGDVRDPRFNDAVADETAAAWGGVDVWIGNAGISPVVAGPLDTSPEVWREVIDVNLTGALPRTPPNSSLEPYLTSTEVTYSRDRACKEGARARGNSAPEGRL
jgi:3-oxoacyl-[acyl-carrier protein] reductase